jgi:hypothetical protein
MATNKGERRSYRESVRLVDLRALMLMRRFGPGIFMPDQIKSDRGANNILPAHEINVIPIAGEKQVGKTQHTKILMS